MASLIMLLGLVFPAWQPLASSVAPRCAARATRVPPVARVVAGIFDGVKDAFKNPSAPQDEDRITPIDRWLGIDKDVRRSPVSKKVFTDPTLVANYRQISLAKPMGIKFVENSNGGGIVVDGLVAAGSAASNGADVKPGDQLVGVDGNIVLDMDFDTALSAIMGATGAQVRLTFFRGAQQFLYGPTRPTVEWLRANVL